MLVLLLIETSENDAAQELKKQPWDHYFLIPTLKEGAAPLSDLCS